jgi:hypothetical protein
MTSEFADKIRTLGFSTRRGMSEHKPVVDERDGSLGGSHTEHWDGSQDAHALIKPIRLKVRRTT